MKLSTWDEQVINNNLNNNTNNINYHHKIEDMFNNNTNSYQKMDGDFNTSHLDHVDQSLNFSSFGSFLAGKYVRNWHVNCLNVDYLTRDLKKQITFDYLTIDSLNCLTIDKLTMDCLDYLDCLTIGYLTIGYLTIDC